jgi:predicted nucleic acid-binding protein
MICVLDTSVVVPALVDSGPAGAVARAALSGYRELIAPALLDTEVAHVLRGRVRGGKLPEELARAALTDLAVLPVERFHAFPLLGRIWELRDNVTAYDATYVALAELFDAELVTADAALAAAAGPRCLFRVLTSAATAA